LNDLLNASAIEIARWLGERLPTLSEKWWSDTVISRLTFQQQRLAEEKRLTKLEGLDLAALLRVFDQNWHEISAISRLPKDGRNWVKELQGARNRWAHAPTSGLAPKDSYRDADTLSRVLDLIQASSDLQAKVEVLKESVLIQMGVPANDVQRDARATRALAPVPEQTPKVEARTTGFSVGQLVCLKSNPLKVFPVLELIASNVAESRYRVFENGAKQVYYESQLQALEVQSDVREPLTAAELSALLTSVQLLSPSASVLYSLNSGRVRFVPYQYRPVFKLIRADRPRLLIADEVGVGKTIEAGLVLKELQARNDIKSVLIICPKALVSERKWELEMKRFDEHFVPLDGSLLRHCIKEAHLSGDWPMQYEKVIIPTSLFDNDLLFGKPGKGRSRDLGLLELDPAPKFDLVIVDEAHHIRNSDTFLHQAVRYFSDNAEAVLFLSATPVQLGREDLYTLLNVLRPDVIIDSASFSHMAEPNQYINQAIQACRVGEPGWTVAVQESLRAVAATSWGRSVLSVNPGFQHIYDGLSEGASEGVSRIKTIQSLEDIYTFSSLINRTRRRDIGEFTTRKAETVTTDFTPSQKALHDDLLNVVGRILGRLHGNLNVKFMMTTVSRQASSSLYGLAPALEDTLLGKLNQLENDEGEDEETMTALGKEFLESIRGEIEGLIVRARQLDPVDPKADAFVKVVSEKVLMPKNKVLMFSTFRHTLRYLGGKLKAKKIRFEVVHGGVPDGERATLRKRFSLPKDDPDALDVLLSSEVGCEGLDFQFCDCLVNYDLPWNPMRIEQRIGRIDRYGQESQAIAIFNFVTPGTIDAEIYDRCLSRIGVFQHAIGGNEEILGDITRELHDIANTFDLSEEERALRIKQLSDNKIRQIEEEQKLEERQGELFGLNLAAASWEERMDNSRNFWLEPEALVTAVSTYLSKRLGKDHDYFLGDKQLKSLRLGVEARAALLEDYRALPRSTDPTYRSWEKWLKGGSPTLAVTFEQECAVDNANAVLLSLGHPLLRQAAIYLQQKEAVQVRLRVFDEKLPIGTYPFALYSWSKQGVKRDEQLIPVAENQEIVAVLLDLLKRGQDANDLEAPEEGVWDKLDEVHHQLWMSATAEHNEYNKQLVGVRIQSLSASHKARVSHLEERVLSATNEKIRLMRRAELQRAEADFYSRIESLNRFSDSGDIRATPTIFGVIAVEGPK
jgi:SNF2 family DNA or RNA helicase